MASEISPPLPVPKCVILYADGALSSVDSGADASLHNLHKLVQDGCVGPLMLRKSGTDEGMQMITLMLRICALSAVDFY